MCQGKAGMIEYLDQPYSLEGLTRLADAVGISREEIYRDPTSSALSIINTGIGSHPVGGSLRRASLFDLDESLDE